MLNRLVQPLLRALLLVSTIDFISMLVLDVLDNEVLSFEAFFAEQASVFLPWLYFFALVAAPIIYVFLDEFLGGVCPGSRFQGESLEGC